MTDENRAYFEFYLQGRDDGDDECDELSLDYPALGARVVDGSGVREVALETAKGCAGELLTGGMATWNASSRRVRIDVKAAGGDLARAYKSYHQGVVDALAQGIEDEVLVAIAEGDEYSADGDEDDGDEKVEDEPEEEDGATADD